MITKKLLKELSKSDLKTLSKLSKSLDDKPLSFSEVAYKFVVDSLISNELGKA